MEMKRAGEREHGECARDGLQLRRVDTASARDAGAEHGCACNVRWGHQLFISGDGAHACVEPLVADSDGPRRRVGRCIE
jgi:hypothetical protein